MSDAQTDRAARIRTAAVLVNAGSRRGRHLVESVRERLEARGIVVQRSGTLEEDFDRELEAALAEGPDLVVLASGDGTLSHAVARLAHRDVVLGILPTGTTNNFARGLDIPLDVDGALDVIAHGKVAEVDLGTVDDAWFANVVSLGISVHIANTVSPRLKRLIGRGAYAVAGLRALLRHRPVHVRLETDEGVFEYETHQLIVANGRFHAGVLIDPDERPDDGLLVVFHLGDRRRLALLRSLVLYAVGAPRTLRRGNVVRVQRVHVDAEPGQDLECDGEIRARTPADIGIDTRALKVMVPRSWH